MTTDQILPPDEPQIEQHYIVQEDGKVIFTIEGIRYYAPYYKRMGIDINTITNIQRLTRANRFIRELILDDKVQKLKSGPQTMEHRWLLALLECNMPEFDRLDTLLKKRKETGLKRIK